jgi:hypothetical protein
MCRAMRSLFAILVTAGLAGNCGASGAAPVLLGTSVNPTGVDGLVVDGITYDVTFSAASYVATYPAAPTFEGNVTGAHDAAVALRTFLNASGVTGLLGSDCATNGFGCDLLIPEETLAGTPVQIAGYSDAFGLLATPGWFDFFFSGGLETTSLGCGLPFGVTCQEFVVFTPVTTAQVPEPVTLALLGAGLAAVGFARRCKVV